MDLAYQQPSSEQSPSGEGTSPSTTSEKRPLPPHQRYQFKPHTGSSHRWALNFLTSLNPSTRLLDIGCGGGAIGRELQARGFKELYAVEIDEETRAHAAPYYRQIEASVEPFMGQTFDVVLLLDVIEHMPEPEAYLSKIAHVVRPGGTLLISVPNIAHWSVRIPLLFGHFEYLERGLLDRTHLQFFTARRVRMISERVPAFAWCAQEGSIAPAEFVLPAWISESTWFEVLRKIRKWSACMLPGLFAFQHLARFERRG